MRKLQEDFKKAQAAIPRYTKRSQAYFTATGLSAEKFSLQTAKVVHGLGLAKDEAEAFATRFEKGRRAILQVNSQLMITAGSLGATGLAIRGVTRELFWMGLGAMFITMSYARMHRQFQMIERGLHSYRRTLRGIRRSEREVTDAIREFGLGSEAANEAAERHQERLEDLAYTEEMLRAQVEQTMYAQLMLWFGTIPTVLRLGSELYARLYTLVGIMFAETIASYAAGTATGFWGTMLTALGIQASAANVQLAMTLALTAALTGGVMLLTYALSTAMIQGEMDKVTRRMKEMNAEFGISDTKLTKGSLVDSLFQTRDALKAVSQAGRELEIGELGRAGTAVNVKSLNIGNVQIYATVRGEEDIRKIRRELDDWYYTTIRARGL